MKKENEKIVKERASPALPAAFRAFLSASEPEALSASSKAFENIFEALGGPPTTVVM